MTPSELDAIEARAKAATEGPWEASLLDDWSDQTTVEGPQFVSGQVLPQFGEWDGVTRALQAQIHADATFIAHARSDVPALVEEVRWMRHGAASASALVNEMRQGHPVTCVCRACAASAYLNQMAEGKP